MFEQKKVAPESRTTNNKSTIATAVVLLVSMCIGGIFLFKDRTEKNTPISNIITTKKNPPSSPIERYLSDEVIHSIIAEGIVGQQQSYLKHRRELIINGKKAFDINPYPYFAVVVTVFEKNKANVQGNQKHWGFCGGSLIHDDIVVTAAHCLIDERDVKFPFDENIEIFVFLGGSEFLDSNTDVDTSDADKTSQLGNGEFIMANNKLLHEGYVFENYQNDILLVKLANAPTKGQKPVKLDFGADPSHNAEVLVIGHGKVGSEESASISTDLKEARMKVVRDGFADSETEEEKICKYLDLPAFYDETVKDLWLCLADIGEGMTCSADSGGPVVDATSGKQVGIVSHFSGTECDSKDEKGNFEGHFATRIKNYEQWIKDGICSLTNFKDEQSTQASQNMVCANQQQCTETWKWNKP